MNVIQAPSRIIGSWSRAGKRLLAVLPLVAVSAWAVLWYFQTNFHVVLANRVYRSAQLTPDILAHSIDRYGLRSIINLRGKNTGVDWYEKERQVAAARDVQFYDVAIDSGHPPTGEELRQLVDVLSRCPKPVCLHCCSGVDRSSIASALAVLLLDDDQTPADALRQFSWWYGYMPWAEHRNEMKAPFRAYQAWLFAHGLKHRAQRFHNWLLHPPQV